MPDPIPAQVVSVRSLRCTDLSRRRTGIQRSLSRVQLHSGPQVAPQCPTPTESRISYREQNPSPCVALSPRTPPAKQPQFPTRVQSNNNSPYFERYPAQLVQAAKTPFRASVARPVSTPSLFPQNDSSPLCLRHSPSFVVARTPAPPTSSLDFSQSPLYLSGRGELQTPECSRSSATHFKFPESKRLSVTSIRRRQLAGPATPFTPDVSPERKHYQVPLPSHHNLTKSLGQGIQRKEYESELAMEDAPLMEVLSLSLGEPLIKDLLFPAPSIPQRQIREDRAYMRNLVQYMKKTGKPPYTQRIEVNTKNEVIGGNHRTLAAWLLGWTHIRALRVEKVAGWSIPFDESNRKPIEKAIGLNF